MVGKRCAAMWVAVATVIAAGSVSGQQMVDLPGQDRTLSADFEEVYRIGSLDGEMWETFGEIAGTAFDDHGNLYVLDRQANQVTVIGPDGEFVRTVGQPGEGPGEFRMALDLTVMPDGELVVADLGHRSYQLFGADGAYQRMVSMGEGDMIRVGDLAPDPSGHAIIMGGGGGVVAMRQGPGGGPSLPETRPIERVALDGDVVDVTTIVDGWLPPRSSDPERLEGGGMSFSVSMAGPRVFEPGLLLGTLPDGGVAFSDSTTYTVKIASPTGGVARVLRRPFTPRPVTQRMQEAERQRQLEDLEAGEGPRMRMMVSGPGGGAQAVSQDAIKEMMRGRIEQLQFYPELPVLIDLATSRTGKIWAQRRGDQPSEGGPIDVLTTEGAYVGTFPTGSTELPDAFGPDGLAAYIETDEFEVPVVVVRRLPGAVR